MRIHMFCIYACMHVYVYILITICVRGFGASGGLNFGFVPAPWDPWVYLGPLAHLGPLETLLQPYCSPTGVHASSTARPLGFYLGPELPLYCSPTEARVAVLQTYCNPYQPYCKRTGAHINPTAGPLESTAALLQPHWGPVQPYLAQMLSYHSPAVPQCSPTAAPLRCRTSRVLCRLLL